MKINDNLKFCKAHGPIETFLTKKLVLFIIIFPEACSLIGNTNYGQVKQRGPVPVRPA